MFLEVFNRTRDPVAVGSLVMGQKFHPSQKNCLSLTHVSFATATSPGCLLWMTFGRPPCLLKAKRQHWRHLVAWEQSTSSPFPIPPDPFPCPHLKQSYPKQTLTQFKAGTGADNSSAASPCNAANCSSSWAFTSWRYLKKCSPTPNTIRYS